MRLHALGLHTGYTLRPWDLCNPNITRMVQYQGPEGKSHGQGTYIE